MDNLKKALEEAKVAVGGYQQAVEVLKWCTEVVKDFQVRAEKFIEETEKKIKEDETQEL